MPQDSENVQTIVGICFHCGVKILEGQPHVVDPENKKMYHQEHAPTEQEKEIASRSYTT